MQARAGELERIRKETILKFFCFVPGLTVRETGRVFVEEELGEGRSEKESGPHETSSFESPGVGPLYTDAWRRGDYK